jgi:signal transduction histidine kinase
MVVLSPRDEPLPGDTEARRTDFTELFANAIANAEARVAIGRLLDEQAVLRRVATLVAAGTGADELFAAVAEEVQQLLGAESSAIVRFECDETVLTVGAHGGPYPAGTHTELDTDFVVASVRRTRRAARFDTDDPAAAHTPAIARQWGIRSAVATPIVVEGELWGAIVVASGRSLPPESEERLGDFTDLVATAVANTQARQEVTALAAEHAALRRVATLVAQEASHAQVVSTIAREIGELLGLELIRVVRYEADGTAEVVAGSGVAEDLFPVGSRTRPEVDSATSRVFRTREAVRIDDYVTASDTMTQAVRSAGVRGVVATPIWVEGRLWGAMTAGTTQVEPLPPDTESRLRQFTELMGTAIANAESRRARAVLTEEQAALRHVATLVAEVVPPAEIFSTVSNEVAMLFGTEMVVVGKFDGDPAELLVVGVGDGTDVPVLGSRWNLDDALASTAVYRTGLAARFDHDSSIADPAVAAILERFRPVATVAVPIKVEGRLWGTMIVSTRQAMLPTDTEDHLQRFTDLIATAIANAEARAKVERLAEEQAALRRLAVLVAQQPSPDEVFTAVIQAVGLLFSADLAVLHAFQDDGAGTTVAGWSGDGGPIPTIGSRFPLVGDSVAARIFETGAPARIDSYTEAEGEVADLARRLGLRSTIGAPIHVEGKVWGALLAGTRGVEPWAEDAETRIAAFTELVATAIANAEGRSELAASRRRIVAASDDARRRIERDLHDGVQQHLVSLRLEVGAMKADPPTGDALTEQLDSVSEGLGSVFDALVEIARGIHPAILTQGGLAAALRALARRSAVPVELRAQIAGPIPDQVEVAAYYVVAEALTNAAKHARASVVHMDVTTHDGILTLMVRDDGVGAVDPGAGSGLVGLRDRVEALGGTITIDSSAGRGTCVVATLPVATQPDQQIENLVGPRREPGLPASPV